MCIFLYNNHATTHFVTIADNFIYIWIAINRNAAVCAIKSSIISKKKKTILNQNKILHNKTKKKKYNNLINFILNNKNLRKKVEIKMFAFFVLK